MGCKDFAKLTDKHPPGAKPDPAVAAAVREAAVEGMMTCAAAHDLASKLSADPSEVGRTLDLLEYRIIECQMGLFGYSPQKKIVLPADTVSDQLSGHLEGAVVDGRVSCASCWEAAASLGLRKMDASAACERLGIKIGPCQLGAF